jgi:D-3-phosphoglycerate dehydrogenase
MEVLGPYLPLAAKLGRLALQLAGPEVRRLEVEVYGQLAEYDTRLLTVAVLNGAFQDQAEQRVNYVNAPLIAAERGIEVSEAKRLSSRDLPACSQCGPEARGAGRTSGADARQWRVSALGFELEIELAPRMLLLRYDDVPGVIGRVGNALGRAGVNIANMAVSRNNEGGKALMALSVDSPAPPELLVELREGMDDAFVIQLRGED